MSLFEPSLTVVIPAPFNEADNLKVVLPDALRFMSGALRKLHPAAYRRRFKDGTASVIIKVRRQSIPSVQVITHPRNLGLTAALRSGFSAPTASFQDLDSADGQIPISELDKMLRAYRGEDLLLTTYRHRPDGLWRATMSKNGADHGAAGDGLCRSAGRSVSASAALIDELNLVCMRSAGSIGLEIAAKSHALGKRIGRRKLVCAAAVRAVQGRRLAQHRDVLWRDLADPPLAVRLLASRR